MKTVREMFVSLTTMLINHIWASIIEICVEKWRTQSLKKFEIQMSRHEKRYRSEEMAPVRARAGKNISSDEHKNIQSVLKGDLFKKQPNIRQVTSSHYQRSYLDLGF